MLRPCSKQSAASPKGQGGRDGLKIAAYGNEPNSRPSSPRSVPVHHGWHGLIAVMLMMAALRIVSQTNLWSTSPPPKATDFALEGIRDTLLDGDSAKNLRSFNRFVNNKEVTSSVSAATAEEAAHDVNEEDNTSQRSIQELHAPFNDQTFMFVAFYYPWYIRDDWSKHGSQGHTPLLGLYGSDEIETAERHIEMAVRGGIDAWAVSWWNQDAPSSKKFLAGMLKAKNIDQMKFTMVYESIGALPVNGDFSNGTLALDKFISDMIFFRDTYFDHPSYLYINGRPVVYVYLTRYWKNYEPSMLDRVKKEVGKDLLIIADEPYYGSKMSPRTASNGIVNGTPVFEAYTSYNMYTHPSVEEGERAVDYMFREALPIYEKWSNETVFFPHVLPKYHDFRDGHNPLKGDTDGLLAQLNTFACLDRPVWYKNEFPNLMFVTSFNEWWEGTSIEPDVEDQYGYSYLDTIKTFKDSEVQCSSTAVQRRAKNTV